MNRMLTVQSTVDGRLLALVRKLVVTVFRPERATILRLRMVARHVQGVRPKRATKELVQQPVRLVCCAVRAVCCGHLDLLQNMPT